MFPQTLIKHDGFDSTMQGDHGLLHVMVSNITARA